MIKRFCILLLITILLVTLIAPAALAAGKNGKSGKSNIAHLYLYEKDPVSWEIVEEGAWGKMKYNTSGSEFDFVFNGHELEPGYDYTLIYYPSPGMTTPLSTIRTPGPVQA